MVLQEISPLASAGGGGNRDDPCVKINKNNRKTKQGDIRCLFLFLVGYSVTPLLLGRRKHDEEYINK